MQQFVATGSASAATASSINFSDIAPVLNQDPRYAQYKVIRRNGSVVGFEPSKISLAMTKAYIAVNGGQGAASARIREMVAKLTETVVNALMRRQPNGGTFHIEDIQDQVELTLMRSGEHEVARSYVLYREERARNRAKQKTVVEAAGLSTTLHVLENGQKIALDMNRLTALIQSACVGLGEAVEPALILKSTLKDLYDGVPAPEVRKSAILSARSLIEKDPAYTFATARLLLHSICFEALGVEVSQDQMQTTYVEYFPSFIQNGIDAELLDARLARFDLRRLAEALDAKRDLKFGYLGLQTLYDRYFLHVHERHIELPQAFF
ncbi:MAG: ATP cone domain-containing protein, partial [Burkholderiales bacterium]